METIVGYFLILILEMLGIAFHVMQKISILRGAPPKRPYRETVNAFLQEDIDTLIVSCLVLFLNLVAHFILDIYTDYPETITNYALWAFGIALVLGYGGQRIIYRYLGTAEKFLNKRVDEKLPQ
jgi:hypothetical protein